MASRSGADGLWRYADGEKEEVVLRDGTEFADWIGPYDVPGSKHAKGIVREGSAGQVRTFSLAPSRKVAIDRIVIESYDNELSPTFVALTAELAGERPDADS